VQVQDLIRRQVDDVRHGLRLGQALEGPAVGRKYLSLCGAELGPCGVPMRRDHNPLAFNGDLNLGLRFEVYLFEHGSIENDPARGANARQSLHEWHLQ
jgi:hypothetical protein